MAGIVVASAMSSEMSSASPPAVSLREQAQQLFEPLEASAGPADTPARIELGRRLFTETALSINRTQSCASCHPLDGARAGMDNRPVSLGAEEQRGDRNTPTVLNARFDLAHFRDGRAKDLETQAKGPILSPSEMGLPSAEVATERLRELPYTSAFSDAFPGEKDPVTFDNAAAAIAAFERTLVSVSRFDEWLQGDEHALTSGELRGLDRFIDLGCTACHVGPGVGGGRFVKSGVVHPYPHEADEGRFKVTGREVDRFVFKVPSLRNVMLTAPYFHDGKVATLAEAVDLMAYMQLGHKLSDDEIRDILQFLAALSDRPRTTATPPVAASPDWRAFEARIAQTPDTELAREGLAILRDTATMIGPGTARPEDRFSGAQMSCTSCHLEHGSKPYGLAWIGVTHRYPRYSGVLNVKQPIEQRINVDGCMERSLNGRGIPEDSHAMKAMVAYFDWMSRDIPGDTVGGGAPVSIHVPDRAANPSVGAELYQSYCQACHGANGAGYRAMAAASHAEFAVPPLWGDGSFNDGASMHRVLTSAAFIRGNMPLGTPWDRPVLSEEQAYDIAAYINSMPRPKRANLEKDYPDLSKKPPDCPYPPYDDDFPQSQHQFGPFGPIIEHAKAKAAAAKSSK
jgi:cytochrome c peroxidase